MMAISFILTMRQYKCQRVFMLDDLEVVLIEDSDSLTNAWKVSLYIRDLHQSVTIFKISTSKKSFLVVAATPQEKSEWIQHICKANGKKPLLSDGLHLYFHSSAIVIHFRRPAEASCSYVGA